MIEWKMITFHLFITFITLTTSFIHYQLFKYKFHHNIKYLQVLDENSAVKNAESLFIAPTLAVPAEEFNRLRKSLPRQTVSSVISKSKMISYVNGTPFCLCVDYLSGSNFCIMAKPGETGFIMEPFLTWIRKVRVNEDYNPEISGFMICRKSHLMLLNIEDRTGVS